MSGLLSRIAARSVGEAVLAEPRRSARFESPGALATFDPAGRGGATRGALAPSAPVPSLASTRLPRRGSRAAAPASPAVRAELGPGTAGHAPAVRGSGEPEAGASRARAGGDSGEPEAGTPRAHAGGDSGEPEAGTTRARAAHAAGEPAGESPTFAARASGEIAARALTPAVPASAAGAVRGAAASAASGSPALRAGAGDSGLAASSPAVPAAATASAASSRAGAGRASADDRSDGVALQATATVPAATPAGDEVGHPVAAGPVVAAQPAARSPAIAAIHAPPDAPQAPVVRVHIGRLEVRANLQAAPPAPPAPSPRRRDGSALSDYLRGSRNAT